MDWVTELERGGRQDRRRDTPTGWFCFWGWASEVVALGPTATAETHWSTEAQPD